MPRIVLAVVLAAFAAAFAASERPTRIQRADAGQVAARAANGWTDEARNRAEGDTPYRERWRVEAPAALVVAILKIR